MIERGAVKGIRREAWGLCEGLQTTALTSPRDKLDFKITSTLHNKLSETIPVQPEHKYLLNKKKRTEFPTYSDTLRGKPLTLTVRGDPSRQRHRF